MELFLRPHLLETLLAGLPAYVFSLRREDLSLVSVSDGVSALTGFEARDLLARPYLWASRLHTDDREEIAKLVLGLAEGPVHDAEFRFLCADGRLRWFRLRLTHAPGPPGDSRAVAGIAWANEEVKIARRRAFQGVSILETVGAAIFYTDLEGKIRLWNGECERLFGFVRSDVVGTPIGALLAIPENAAGAFLRTARDEGTMTRETRLSTRSGEVLDGILTLSLVRDEAGRPAGMVGLAAGTAERRGLESKLQELVTRLRLIERVNRIIASDWDLRKTHGKIATEFEKLVSCDRTSITVFDEGKDPLLIVSHVKGRTGLAAGERIPLEGSSSGWVLSTRMTRIDGDMTKAEDQFAENPLLIGEGMRSRLMIPLFVGDHIVGTLNFHSRKKEAYSLDTVEELGSIPDQLALAIDKYLTYTRLQSSEEKYRLLFEQGPPAVTVDRDGRFVDVNEGCLGLYGYSREEFLGRSVAEIAADPAESLHYRTVLETGQPLEAEVLGRRRDGTTFWGWLNIFPVSDRLVLGQITDISARKRAEEALRREKDFSSSILSVANALIVVLDAEGRILLFNRKCEEVTGWGEREIRGRFLWDDLLPDRHTVPFRAFFDRLAEADIPAAHEIPWRTREGRERLILWNNSVIRDERGRVLWVIGAGIDMTDQRELEDRLRQAQKMEAIGTLAGGIAHDFNNIVQAIMGYASLMRSHASERGVRIEEIDAIEQAGLRAAELTNQLLGFARGGKYEVRPADLNTVVEKVVSMIRHTFDRSIAIRTVLAPDLRAVEGDGGQLEHTLLNLCINARDAMPDGGVLLVETRNETVSGADILRIAEATGHRAETPPGGFVSLSVTDTGVGIPSGDLPRIFEPFFTTKEPGKGSGMGLAMAYGIVKNHGGIMDVRSAPGMGTTFRILLPATGSEAAPLPVPDLSEPSAGGTETILYVDDEESLRLLAVETLGRLGYRVITAQNGVEALDVFSARPREIDLVILDMIMPGMGGEETFRRMKAIDPASRVLLSSGYAVEGKPGTLLADGAAGFLQKPYRLATLAAAVRRALAT